MYSLRSNLLAFGLLSCPCCVLAEPPAASRPAAAAEDEPHGPEMVKIDADARAALGIDSAPVEATRIVPEIQGFGLLEEDPATVFTLRAPLSGYLRAANEHWPTVGQTIAAGAIVGALVPRFTALELLDVQTRRLDAQAEVDALRSQIVAEKSSYESKRDLSAKNQGVSERAVEEAEAKLRSDQAKLTAAERRLALLSDAAAQAGNLAAVDLRVTIGGTVTDAAAVSGEAVESGQVLLRVSSLSRLLVRVEIPPGRLPILPVRDARLSIPGGNRDEVRPAEWVGLAPRSGVTAAGTVIMLAVNGNDQPPLRPGMPVIAHLPAAGDVEEGVLLPRSAILRSSGLTWVYVRHKRDHYERRQVQLRSPTTAGWTATGVTPGEKIVITGAQLLLSEELKSQIESEAAASGD